jgi:hypothetical protein
MERGTFCIRNAGDNCIAGKYFNDGTPRIYTESSIRIIPDNEYPEDFFCGTYFSSWIENNETAENSRLIISRRANAVDIYTLLWFTNDNPSLFSGEGMMAEGLLVGHYWEQ